MALRQEELTSLCDDVDLDRDRALVERCQAGDSAAFGNLYARYYERLLRFCLRRLNDRHEAEDATQEAFARAWKALPRFAGDRRFYPWLTVIAGNICTDMLRRRSRSTPTDDLELTVQQPVGAESEDTSEELVLAAVDGELVNRALDRLSMRHRHVLAMREGSGWSYQRIADHEGVEIGTVETLLWRARQALKREFAAVSESKGALAGFLVATGALVRRTIFRAAHRSASVQHQSGGPGGAAQRRGRRRRHGGSGRGCAHRPAHAVRQPEPGGEPRAPHRPGPGSLLGAPARAAGAATRVAPRRPKARPPGSPGSAPGTGIGCRHTGAHSSAPRRDRARPRTRRSRLAHRAAASTASPAGRATPLRWRRTVQACGQQHRRSDGGDSTDGVTGASTPRSSGVTSAVSNTTQSLGLGTVVPGTGSGAGLGHQSTPTSTTTTTAPGLPGGLGSPVSTCSAHGVAARRPGSRRRPGRNAAGPDGATRNRRRSRSGVAQSPAAAPHTVSTIRPLTT